MSAKITTRDQGYTKTLRLLRQAGLSLTLGVQGPQAAAEHRDPDGASSGLTVGELAAIHELGLGVPERSWLRAWFEENHKRVVEDLRTGLVQVVAGRMTVDQLGEVLGVRYVGDIQARISNGIPPPLADSTIARKGSSVPLIDTGQLRSAITYVVTRRLEEASSAG